MSLTPDILLRIAALGLSKKQQTAVLEIVADVAAPGASRRSNDADRQQRRRDKLKAETSRDDNVTHHVTITRDERDEKEGGSFSLLSPSALPHTTLNLPQENPKRARASRLPEDWQPSTEDWDYAVNIGLSPEQITVEAERFRNHWHAKSGQNGTKMSWSATWKNWAIKAKEISNEKSQRSAPRLSVTEQADALLARKYGWDGKGQSGLGREDQFLPGAVLDA